VILVDFPNCSLSRVVTRRPWSELAPLDLVSLYLDLSVCELSKSL